MNLYYDADCGFCTRCAGVLGRLSLGAGVLPGFSTDEFRERVDLARFADAVALVCKDGRVAFGVVAFGLALGSSSRREVRAAGRLLLAPPVRRVAEPVYAFVAAHRGALPGSSCRL
ncbi:DCC1-like thiol-disulfide oxidoreductase family protein [Rothia sp. LK2588]|uniref:thiol-disulfide oxidoreductase DCC family protein n=1 Tax=Rothia sp. LK2588 TaxID=3114369 RepID=UPI0034CD8CED